MPAPNAQQPPKTHLFTDRDLPWLVDTQAELHGDRPYLIWEPFDAVARVWSYAGFAEETRACAAGLLDAGVNAGDFVLLHLENCPEFLFAWHACSRIGAIAVTTNTNSTADELQYFVEQCGAAVAITQQKFAPLIGSLDHSFRWIAVTDHEPLRPDRSAELENFICCSELRGDPASIPVRDRTPLSPNNVQFTSGTTSRPKGVVWTQGNALWAARTMARYLELTKDDRTIVHFPLFHTNALAYSMLSTLWAGASAVLMPRFSASRFWDVAVRHRCTWASMLHFPVRALLTQADPEQHSFRLWAYAGDISLVRERWGIRTIGWFGMTETVSACIFSDIGFPGTEGAMGRPAAEYGISVRREDGSEASPEETGRLFIKGVPGLTLFQEYLHDPDATAAAFDSQGWFDTGDEVVVREGEVFLIGRAKDMLKVGGENVAAIEIETIVASVKGVSECAVVGKPDDMLDEVPVAFVVAKSPSPELHASIALACNEKLSKFKVPREIRFIDALPVGLLGKILKRELRDILQSGA